MKKRIKLSNNRKWLERIAKDEDYGSVSAGGLYAKRRLIPAHAVHCDGRRLTNAECEKLAADVKKDDSSVKSE